MTDQALVSVFNADTALFDGAPVLSRRLSDLAGAFADERAYARELAHGDPLLYTVSTVAPATGEGQLHYALGKLMPGKVGAEYYLTRGHCHAWRAAAEAYVGLSGEGSMLLEDEATGHSRLLPLRPHTVVYVPGHTAHRTINTGAEPLVYLGIYPAGAGHDYAALAGGKFRSVLIERDGQPVLLPRSEFQRACT